MPLVLGVDSSTQATKVEVRDADTGALVATGRSPHPRTTPPRSEQDPAVWWTALLDAVRQTGQRDIAAVSVAAEQHGLVVTDKAGAVLRPAKLWNDTESEPETAALVEQIGRSAWAATVGTVPVAAMTITKLAWLARREPGTYARLGHVMVPHDWLTYRLTGRIVTDRGDASGTGYWSPQGGRWRPDVLRWVDRGRSETEWLECLPKVLGPSERADWMAASVHQKVGLRGRPIVAAGTGDNMAAALATGGAVGQTTVCLGTTGIVHTVAERAVEDESGAVAGFADATGRFLPLVCTDNAAKATDLVARLLGVSDHELAELALAAPAGADGLVLVPYLDGERTPNAPNATGLLSGLRSDATREQLARAAFEGVVCSLLDSMDALASAGVGRAARPVNLTGRGARSEAYRRVLADLLGEPIVVPTGEDPVATGACVQAAAALSQRPPEEVSAAWRLGGGLLVEPDRGVDRAAIRGRYADARDRLLR